MRSICPELDELKGNEDLGVLDLDESTKLEMIQYANEMFANMIYESEGEESVNSLYESAMAPIKCILATETVQTRHGVLGMLDELNESLSETKDISLQINLEKVFSDVSNYEELMEAASFIFNEAAKAKTVDELKANLEKAKSMKFTSEDQINVLWKYLITMFAIGVSAGLCEVSLPLSIATTIISTIAGCIWMTHNSKCSELSKINSQSISIAKKLQKKKAKCTNDTEKANIQKSIDALSKISDNARAELTKVQKDVYNNK